MAGNEKLCSEDYFRLFFNKMSDAAFLADAETGVIIDVNDSLTKLTGISRNILVGSNQSKLHSDPSQGKRNFMERLNSNIHEIEGCILTKKGIVPVLFTYSVINFNGKMLALCIIKDITMQRRFSEDLAKTNAELNYVLNSIKAAIYISKASGDFGATFITSNVKDLTGFDANSFVNDSSFWINHIHPDDKSRILSELKTALKRDFYNYDYRFLTKKGDYIWIRDEINIIKNSAGQPFEIVGYWADITERKKLEEELRESEERFKIIFNKSPVGVALLGVDFHFKNVNEAFSKMMGYSEDEFRKLTFVNITHKNNIEADKIGVTKLINRELSEYKTEKKYVRKDGVIVWANTTVRIVFDDNNKPLYFIAIVDDITSSMIADDIIESEEKKLDAIFRNVNIGIALTSPDQDIITANPSLCNILGYSLSEIRHITFRDFTHPDDLKESFKLVKSLASGKINNFTVEKKYVRKDKKIIHGRVHVSSVKDASGKIVYNIVSLEDITEHKKAEELIIVSQKMLKSTFSSISDLVFVIDKDGAFTYYHAPKSSLLYVKPGFFIGKKVSQVMPKYFIKLFNDSFAKNRKGLVAEFDYPLKIKNKELQFNARISPLIIDGAFNGSVAVVRDITEKKLYEENLIREKKWSDLLIKLAPNIIIGLGEDSKILLFNKFAEKITGYKEKDVLGKKWISLFIPKKSQKTLWSVWYDIVKNKRIEHHYTNTLLTKKGKEIMIFWNNNVLNENGKFKMVLSIGENVKYSKK